MKSEDRVNFLKLMTGIGAVYGKSINEALMDIYWGCLQRYGLSEVSDAVYGHINNPDMGQFFPKPADIIRQIEGDSESKGLTAWNKVFKTIESYGGYKSIVFDDPIIHAVISDMSGWVKLAQHEERERPFLQKEFTQRYKVYLKNKFFDYPNKLIGMFESQNSSRGYKSGEPVFIGNIRKAREILEGKIDEAVNQEIEETKILAFPGIKK